MDDTIYEAREDSFLLAKSVQDEAHGDVLDVGTGSGILAETASMQSKVKSVTAVDVNPQVIEYCRTKYPEIKFIQSDLFEKLDGKYFDTIIFNPPYLPTDDEHPDIALDGGKEGWELVQRFFKTVKTHLKKQGMILILFSSNTYKEKVEEIIWANGFDYVQIGYCKIEFEELFVYKCTKDN